MEELEICLFRPAILPSTHGGRRIRNRSFPTSNSTSYVSRSGNNPTKEYKNAADLRELVSSDRRIGNNFSDQPFYLAPMIMEELDIGLFRPAILP
eukprot:6193385-Ditylum_brightwellii.AAC.1